MVTLRTYMVKSLAVQGKRNRIFLTNTIVNEADFPPGNAEKLADDGHLERLFDQRITYYHGNGQHMGKIYNHCRANLNVDQVRHIYSTATHTTLNLKPDNKEPVSLSLLMPFFRAKNIGWLALESLTRQEGVTFTWELIIMEEDIDLPFGWNGIEAYKEKLKAVGCVQIKYVKLNQWIPLSAKWHFMIQLAESTSKVAAFNSADVYCSKHRLKNQHAILTIGEYNWYRVAGNVVYDIASEMHVKRIRIGKDKGDTVMRATTMDIARRLPLQCVKKSVDGWTYNSFTTFGLIGYYDESDIWKDAINVNGLNNISLTRGRRIQKILPPLQSCCESIENHLPMDIVARLRTAKMHLQKHSETIQKSIVKI